MNTNDLSMEDIEKQYNKDKDTSTTIKTQNCAMDKTSENNSLDEGKNSETKKTDSTVKNLEADEQNQNLSVRNSDDMKFVGNETKYSNNEPTRSHLNTQEDAAEVEEEQTARESEFSKDEDFEQEEGYSEDQ